ncbi:MAG: MULTIHEME CYTC protein, partial [Actinobacteria bacterium]|nr:MULTIHEME CYTC protein [Actinomycetota bacterium]
GEALVVRTPIWLIREKKWNLSYWREMDWLKSCAGCHTTGFNPYLGRYAEEGISCEACHGPGKKHASTSLAADIVNPAKVPEPRRSMICESCHTTGHDVTGEYRFPVGFLPGDDLAIHYIGLTPKPGQDDASFKGNDSYADRHAQFLFWRSRMLLVEGETCDLCKNFRVARKEVASDGPRKMSAQDFCLSCHDGTVVPLPREHGPKGIGNRRCLSCHPAARTSKGNVTIHDHRYIPAEALAKTDVVPSADFSGVCYRCHPVPGKGA